MEYAILAILGLLILGLAFGVIRIMRISDTEDIQDKPLMDQGLFEAAADAQAEINAIKVREEIEARDEHGQAIGYRVRHDTATSRVVVIPIMSKPYKNKRTGEAMPFSCPTCRIVHPVKCVHLYVDDQGTAIVSKGVLEELKSAGMPQLVAEGIVRNPPPLKAGHGVSRAEVDQHNRKIIQYKVV